MITVSRFTRTARMQHLLQSGAAHAELTAPPNSLDSGVSRAHNRVEPVCRELSAGKRVLVVEDSAVLVELALRQLRILEVDAEAVMTGSEAIERSLTGIYDVVLLDLNLPDVNGDEVTDKIRRAEMEAALRPVFIIATTASTEIDRQGALEAGMNDYLPKPIMLSCLKVALERALSSSISQDADRATALSTNPCE